jgi:hypothetical protein
MVSSLTDLMSVSLSIERELLLSAKVVNEAKKASIAEPEGSTLDMGIPQVQRGIGLADPLRH